MMPFRKIAGPAAMALELIFSSAVNAQEKGYVHIPVNGATANIKCQSAFPDGKNLNPQIIAWIDNTFYHKGGTGPIAYALMDKVQRSQQLLHPLNRPIYDNTAQRYDGAENKILELQKILAKSHPDFPVSKWGEIAKHCGVEMR